MHLRARLRQCQATGRCQQALERASTLLSNAARRASLRAWSHNARKSAQHAACEGDPSRACPCESTFCTAPAQRVRYARCFCLRRGKTVAELLQHPWTDAAQHVWQGWHTKTHSRARVLMLIVLDSSRKQ